MGFKLEKAIEGGYGGCSHCGYQHEVLPLDGRICVGFGVAYLSKNGETIFEGDKDVYEDNMSFKEAEDMALKDPDCDWKIHLIAPLSERHYQRQGNGHWVLYKKGEGFA